MLPNQAAPVGRRLPAAAPADARRRIAAVDEQNRSGDEGATSGRLPRGWVGLGRCTSPRRDARVIRLSLPAS